MGYKASLKRSGAHFSMPTSLPSNTMKKHVPTLMTGKDFKRGNKDESAQYREVIYLGFGKRR